MNFQLLFNKWKSRGEMLKFDVQQMGQRGSPSVERLKKKLRVASTFAFKSDFILEELFHLHSLTILQCFHN